MQRVRTAAVVMVAGAVLAAGTGAASARQMRARDEPTVSVPLVADPDLRSCDSKRTRAKGEVVAVFTICLQWYRMPSDAEADSSNDYGALWIRGRVAPKNRWCAQRVKIETVLPSEGTLSNAPPPGKSVTAKRTDKEVTSALTVDAEGAAATSGTITQSYLVRPGTMRVTFDDATRTYRTKWSGVSRKAIAFATGVELAWPQGGAPWIPTQEEAPAILGRFLEPRAC